MNYFKHLLISILLLTISDSIYSQNSYFQKSPYKYSYGDSLKWKDPNFNDSSWQILYDDYIESINKFCWIRTNIYLSQENFNKKELVLLIDLSADYEIYWNGDKFGQNFTGSFEKTSKKGIYSESYSFNDSLTFFKKNVLSIRAKLDDKGPLQFAYLNIADPADIKYSEYKVFGHLFFLMFVYSVLLVLLFNFFRKNMTLFFNVYLTITIIIMIISLFIEYLFFAGLVGYNFNFIGEKIIVLLSFLSLFSISFFFFELNKVKYHVIYLLLIGFILAVSFYLDLDKYYILSIGLGSPLLTVYFYQENKSFLKYYSISFFAIILFFNIAFGLSIMKLFFLVVLFYLSVIYFTKEESYKNKLAIAKLRSARLENEMLKKIIQPHYIMNSINSVIEWIEESPKDGLKFIKELTDEFRSFLKFSNSNLITLKDELELCKKHLKIMEFRHHKKYTLMNKISDLNRKIPPAIFHTLVENGITHNSTKSDTVKFIIEEFIEKSFTEFKISVNYNADKDISTLDVENISINIENYNKIIEGNGLKYIRSRLTESYGDNWELTYYSDNTYWITNIRIYSEDKA